MGYGVSSLSGKVAGSKVPSSVKFRVYVQCTFPFGAEHLMSDELKAAFLEGGKIAHKGYSIELPVGTDVTPADLADVANKAHADWFSAVEAAKASAKAPKVAAK